MLCFRPLRSLQASHFLRPRPPAPLSRPFSSTHSSRFIKPTYFLKNVPSSSSKLDPQTLPSFREHVARANPVKSFSESIKRPKIAKHIIISLMASGAAFAVAAAETNLDTAFWAHYLPSVNPMWSMREPTTAEMHRMRDAILLKRIQNEVDSLVSELSTWPVLIRQFIVHCYAAIGENYLQASEGRRIAWTIGTVTFGIWAAWQIPRFAPFMAKHFPHSPLSGKTYTLMTSVMSHSSFLHWLFNVMALSGFASATSAWMRTEQTHAPSGMQEATTSKHVLAFLFTAGIFSSLCSHLYRARVQYPRIISQLSHLPPPSSNTTPASRLSFFRRIFSSPPSSSTNPAASLEAKVADIIRPSHGLSGAIWSCVVVTVLAFPDSQVKLFFDASPLFSAKWFVTVALGLDFIGVLRGWRFFDHVAHLGGALFGALYWKYGMQFWDWLRVSLWDEETAKWVEEQIEQDSKEQD